MNPLSIIRQFARGLLKENKPWQIGLAIAFGFVIGIIPKSNLTAQLLFLIMMCTKANVPFSFISIFFFSLIHPFTDAIADPLGYFILNLDFLYNFFTKVYNMPVLPWTDFNNTVVLGGLIMGVVLFYPIYLVGRSFGFYYESKFKDKVLNSKVVKSLKASWVLDWYFKD